MKKLVFVLLLASLGAFGQSFYRLSQPFPNTTMNVCPVPSGGNPCPSPVNIYQDQGLTQLITQPVNIGATGNIGFWVSPATSQFTVQIGPPYNTEFIVGGGGGALAYSAITPGSNTSAKTEGTGGSLAPLNIGQVAGSQVWIPNSLMPPAGATLTGNQTGGTLTANHQITVQFVFNSAAGTTWPSVISTVTTPNPCTGGSFCSVTVTAPTIPAGYTGYTTYDCDSTATPGCTPLQQATLSNCVNLGSGVNCIIGTIAAGSAVPTTNTAWVQPPNVQADECPPSVSPSAFVQKNDGTYHTLWGVNNNTANGNAGVWNICQHAFFSDLNLIGGTYKPQDVINYNNSAYVFVHQWGLGVSSTNQDRAMSILAETPLNDSATRYGLEGLQMETDMNCNGCTINGSPDGEVTSLSLQYQDNSVTHYSPQLGANVIRAHLFKSGTAEANSYTLVNGIFELLDHTTPSPSGGITGFRFQCLTCLSGAWNSATWFGFRNSFSTVVNVGNGQVAYYSENLPASTGGVNKNWFLRNDSTGADSNLNGIATLAGLNMNSVNALPFNASLNDIGAVSVSQAGTMTAPSINCTGGASTYTYVLVGVDVNGGQAVSTANSCTTGVNPLTPGNPATISPSNSTANALNMTQFVRIDVYRTGGPMATGKIGSLTCSGVLFGANLSFSPTCTGFPDTGLTATGAVPTVNTTGGVGAVGIIAGGNTVYVASDFTSAANTNLQTITGLTWNVSQAAHKYAFKCSLNYSQATAAASMQFGIQVATAAPNSVDGKGRVDTSATAVASGTLNGLNTTTATAIVTFTPSNFATVFGADLSGTIDLPQNNAGNQINIMVQTSNSGDLPTVKKGSYCSILP